MLSAITAQWCPGSHGIRKLINPLQVKEPDASFTTKPKFAQVILENLKTAGVQQAHKEGPISFTSLAPWPGDLACAEGRYVEGDPETGKPRRAAIFIGPEFGTVTRVDLVAAAREAADAGFDVLIACAFNYEAHTIQREHRVASPAPLHQHAEQPVLAEHRQQPLRGGRQRWKTPRPWRAPERACTGGRPAGTGKTIAAVHRAAFLARQHPDARVLLTTFPPTLAHALHARLRRLIGNTPLPGERIDVVSLDDWGSACIALPSASRAWPRLLGCARRWQRRRLPLSNPLTDRPRRPSPVPLSCGTSGPKLSMPGI